VVLNINVTLANLAPTKHPKIEHLLTEAELIAANVGTRCLTRFLRLVAHAGTVAVGVDDKGCFKVANGNGVTKLGKHLDLKENNSNLMSKLKAGKFLKTRINR
jgi:hypothetical protein